jgi:hypothetical protein
VTRTIEPNARGQSTRIRLLEGQSGMPKTQMNAAFDEISFFYHRDGGCVVPFDTVELSEADSPHEEGGMIHLGAGYFRIDPPDDAWAAGTTGVFVFGEGKDTVIIGAYHPIGGRSGTTPAAPANAIVAPSPSPPVPATAPSNMPTNMSREEAVRQLTKANQDLRELTEYFKKNPQSNDTLVRTRKKREEIRFLERRARGLG